MTSPMDGAEALKRALAAQGARLVGIMPAADLPSVEEFTQMQAAKGYLAEMQWLVRTAAIRTHPGLSLHGAQSIIASLWTYSPSIECGYIARFAQHKDYHEFICERMHTAWEQIIGGKGRALFFVDSQPLAEKAYAAAAGLGWVGKNCLLINKDYGSYFCLGFILTDLGFEYDAGVRDFPHCLEGNGRCGVCSRCIDACPTGALVAPFTLDARRCISYLTIAHKGAIPEDIRHSIGTRIFGCDICQEVCPYNQKMMGEGIIPVVRFDMDSLAPLALMNKDGFDQMFKGTPVHKIGVERFLRNVAVALDNVGGAGPHPF